MRRPLLLVSLIASFLVPSPAQASIGGGRAAFEHFLYHVPKSHWKVVPDSEEAGTLFAGRVGSFATIVHAFYDQGRLTRESVEVALPTDVGDDFALAIITRFLSEYVGHPDELKAVMGTMRSMRKTILASGRHRTQMPYRNALFTLTLDSSTSEFSAKTIEVPWGVLYWRGEADVARRH